MKLEPCPFCGNKEIEVLPIENGYKVRCWQCSASVFEISKFKKSATLIWNKRVSNK